MRCLLCHNSYLQPGGEDGVFADERDLLEANGHEVLTYTEHNEAIEGMSRLGVAARTVWNPNTYARLRDIIRRSRPHVLHCTNVFPLISPAAYRAAHAEGVPVVQSLHNYRRHCSNGFLFRDGRPCGDCLDAAASWAGVRHGCYRGSRAASAVVAAMQHVHALAGTWSSAIDLYIACSEHARRIFVQSGLDPERIVVKPNFVATDPGRGAGEGGHCIFVGRLSPEKGVSTLLDAWARLAMPLDLEIVGDGPLSELVRNAAARDHRIRWRGWLQPDQVYARLREARCLVMPSLWPEIFGRAVIEAFACGTPVVASDIGALSELVDDGATGRLVRSNDPVALSAAVEALARASEDDVATMRRAARRVYLDRYTPDRNLSLLLDAYDRASRIHRCRRRPPEPSSARRPVAPPGSRPPTVSIGVPVYNGSRYLRDALDSLLGQSFTDLEVVIADNASTDDTEAICRDYAAADSRIRYVRHRANIGANRNFNAVFTMSSGRFFKWASHDDVCDPTFVERCVEVLEAEPDVDWCHPRSSHIDEAGRPIHLPGMLEVSYAPVAAGSAGHPIASRESADPARRFAAVLLGEGGCLDSYGLIRADALARTRLVLPHFGAEKVLMAELALGGRFQEIPEVLFYPRVHAAAAGSLRSAADQRLYTLGTARGHALGRRLGLLAGYVRAIRRARLPLTTRLRCHALVGRYVLQVDKWRQVLGGLLSGRSMGDPVRQELFRAGPARPDDSGSGKRRRERREPPDGGERAHG